MSRIAAQRPAGEGPTAVGTITSNPTPVVPPRPIRVPVKLAAPVFTNSGAVPGFSKGTQKLRPLRGVSETSTVLIDLRSSDNPPLPQIGPSTVPGFIGWLEYAVQPAGDRKIIHQGVVLKAGRLCFMDPNNPVTQNLISRGLIASRVSEVTHDWVPGGTLGVEAPESLRTYTVQASGSGKITYGANALTGVLGTVQVAGNTVQLDPLEPSTQALVALGWIA